MKLAILLIVTLVVAGSNPTSGKMKLSKIARMICRRCWNRLYSHCKSGVRLSKRHIADDDRSKPLTRIVQRSRNFLKKLRSRDQNMKGKKPRFIRININNCSFCKQHCFN